MESLYPQYELKTSCCFFFCFFTGSSQTQHIFLPRLSLPPKPSKQPSPEDLASCDEDDRQFYDSEDEEPAEESPDHVTQTEYTGGDEELENRRVKDVTTENCSSKTA